MDSAVQARQRMLALVFPLTAALVDTTGRSSVPGVWAAGNVADPPAR
jgi:hypothetical protein